MLAAFEDIFADGERADSMAESDQIKYPNLLVLKHGKERLVLLFNESDAALSVTLRNIGLESGQKASVFESGIKADNPHEMKVTVPPVDVLAIHIK